MKTPPLLSLLTAASLVLASSCTSTSVPWRERPDLVTDAVETPPATLRPSRPETVAPMRRRKSSAGASSSLALLLGGRILDNTDWAPLDDQYMAGIEFASIPKYFPLGIEVGYQGSYQSQDADNGSVRETLHGGQHEVYIGPRFGISDPGWGLWAGLGFSVIYNHAEAFVAGAKKDGSDTVFGGYAHVGVEYKLAKSFGIGLDARGMYGQDATFLGQDHKTTYLQMALLFAFHF